MLQYIEQFDKSFVLCCLAILYLKLCQIDSKASASTNGGLVVGVTCNPMKLKLIHLNTELLQIVSAPKTWWMMKVNQNMIKINQAKY